MASGDARPIPQKNVAYRVTFPIFDADGDLVTAAGGLDSEISKDGGTFTDVSPGEATEIATSSGMYYLDLSSTEMNADTVAIIVKSTGGKTVPIVLYPEEAGDVRANVTQWNGTNVATPDTAGYPICTVKDGTGQGELNITTGVVDANMTQCGGSTVAAGAIPNAAAAANGGLPTVDANNRVVGIQGTKNDFDDLNDISTTQVENAVWDATRSGHTTGGTFGEGAASVQGNVTGSVASVTGAVGSVTGAVGSVTGSVGGNVDGSVASVTGAVGSVTGAVGSVTGNVGGNVVGSVGSVTGAVGSVTNQVVMRKNVAFSNFKFLMRDDTNHQPATGKTISTKQIQKDAGTFAAITGSVTEIAEGWYRVDLSQTEMNADTILLNFAATDCDDTNVFIITQG